LPTTTLTHVAQRIAEFEQQNGTRLFRMLLRFCHKHKRDGQGAKDQSHNAPEHRVCPTVFRQKMANKRADNKHYRPNGYDHFSPQPELTFFYTKKIFVLQKNLQLTFYISNLFRRIGLELFHAPNHCGPAHIIAIPANDMNMQLRDDVADGTDIQLVHVEIIIDKTGYKIDLEQNRGLLRPGQFIQFDFIGLRHNNKPGEQGITH
jgi:hypothetical protein